MDQKNKEQGEITMQYTVGIGASAGGLEALHELFDFMPPDTGFSFVVIQHLSPDHKSLLSELLAKHTMMPVYEAADGTAMQPNCIYVIPSKKLLTIKDGELHLDEKIKNKVPNNAIDLFFESLAIEKKEQAVGIILSGTGTDGTKGIEEIKRQGGLVIVQDPMSAAFDGMPNSAIAAGIADMILPPEMMADELLDWVNHPPMQKSFTISYQKDEETLRDILQLLQQTTGHDFTNYKRPTLFRRLVKRMTEISLKSIEEYRLYLKSHEDEIKILGKEFLINVTKFFRDTTAFDIVRTQVIPAICKEKGKEETVKIWSMACSSGEEAYSLAILLADYVSREQLDLQVKIFATDIDSEALEFASRGIYPQNISTDIPAVLLEKYFIKEDQFYRVAPSIRKMIVFANHNILKDPPFSKMDLITCRNMLIYLDSYLQNKILSKFYFALNLNSFLFLGPSEHIGLLAPALEEVHRKWKIFRCISKTNVVERETFLSPLENRVYLPSAGLKSKNPQNNLGEIFKDTLAEERAIAGILVDREFNVKQATGNFKDFLQFPQDQFNFNLLKLVVPDLSIALGVSMRKSVAQNEKIVLKRLAVNLKKEKKYVNIIIKPYLHSKEYLQPFLFIILEEEKIEDKIVKTVTDNTITSSGRIDELEMELKDTRENLQAVIEELETANEEMQSSNEEMISTNEELQSTNEELQSLNEELHTVSAEHQNKIKELLELNDDLDNYFSNSNIGQIFIDQKLIIRKFSPGVAPLINLIISDIGRSIADITTNIKSIDLINNIKEVMNSGRFIEKEITLNNNHYYLMRINPYIKKDTTPDGTVINFINITESKKLSGIIEGVFNSSTNGITAHKAIRNHHHAIIDFEYLAINQTYKTIFNIHSGNIIGKKLSNIFPGIKKDLLGLCISVVETGITERTEYYLEETDRWIETTIVKMFDGIVSTHTDITEKKRSGEMLAQSFKNLQHTSRLLADSNVQLEKSNMDLMQFASVASHDLKEPLRKIQAFGNMLAAKCGDQLDDTGSNYLQKMITASGRMQTLIEDVLSLSKLSNNHLPRTAVKLQEVVERIIDDLEITIVERKAKIQIGDLPEVNAVQGQVHQLFQNLISNAIKFNDKPIPEIHIRRVKTTEEIAGELPADLRDKFIGIEVKDNGIGFEKEYKETVFGLFQRLNGRMYEGTGIGLAIAKKIVENHGGLIKVESEVNEGSAFTVLLPAV